MSGAEAGALDGAIVEFVQRGFAARDDRDFGALALGEFRHLYRASATYRAFCDAAGRTPATVERWEEIPPVASFRLERVRERGAPVRDAVALSRRLGVTDLWRIGRSLHPLRRERHARRLEATVGELLAKRYVFPDVDRMELLILLPPPVMAPGMVMARGLARMKPRFGTPGSRFLISFMGLELAPLVRALVRAERTGVPVCLVGATFVIDALLDACLAQGVRFALPPGSRVVDSGGFVARYTGCTKEEYFAKCRTVLGVPEGACVNALWLCESSTVYFDDSLRRTGSSQAGTRSKEVPPWARVVVVDPEQLRPVPRGTVGLLRLHDLTNRAMAISLQTDKMGYETGEGIEVVGNWCRELGSAEVDRSPLHPGGRLATRAMESLLRTQLTSLARARARLG